MTSILLAVGIVAGFGLVFGVGLSVAAAVMDIPADERVERLLEALPGVNCGACGFSGCEGYAQAIAGEGALCNLCTPGMDAVALSLADIMGIPAQGVIEFNALVRCCGTRNQCGPRFDYRGERSCAAAAQLYNGPRDCAYGCLGYGDCLRACPEGAISICGGIAVIDQDICHGCSVCVKHCPKGIIVMAETRGEAMNRCCSREPGAVVRRQCAAGCTGCGLCERVCHAGAVKVEDHLARVDAVLCSGCGICVQKCPAKCLVMQ